ncbi:8-oxo-dGTP diphosphatase MutT [Orbaceae bacterium ac157xtp]
MKKIEIAVGIVRSHDGKIFITQRGENSHLAGFWEFPGGKVEDGETPIETLYREIAEEIDISILEAKFLQTVTHQYSDRLITIHVYLVEEWDGEPFAAEGQISRWVDEDDLCADDFPDANRTIIEMLKNQENAI